MILTYKETIEDARALSYKMLHEDEHFIQKYKAVHPIPAGGIAIGVAIAECIGIKNILSVEEYKNYPNKKEVLVVDDLVDSGKTLLRYPESDTAVLYKKVHCQVMPTFFLKEIGSDWVIFPHEKDKDGILDHLIRVFSFINVQLSEEEEQVMLQILNKIKK